MTDGLRSESRRHAPRDEPHAEREAYFTRKVHSREGYSVSLSAVTARQHEWIGQSVRICRGTRAAPSLLAKPADGLAVRPTKNSHGKVVAPATGDRLPANGRGIKSGAAVA